MIRIHVQKKNIKYLLPDGRKQGFYLRKDVERLANAQHILLTLDEEAPSEFRRATEEDLQEIMRITEELFGGSVDENGVSRMTPVEQRIKWMRKNPDVFYVLTANDQVIGFTYIIPFKRGTDKIEKLLKADFAGEVDITVDDIEETKAGKHMEIYLVAIGMSRSVPHAKRRLFASTLISNLMEVVVELGRKGVIIDTITAIGATTDGRKLLQRTGFSEIPPPKLGKRAFTIKVAESGSPIILQYKEALQESLKETKGTDNSHRIKRKKTAIT